MDGRIDMNAEEVVEERTADLVIAAQAGDREAFGRLAQRYERAVYATALRRLGNHSEAQEVAQEVLVKAMQKLDQLRQPECFGGWLRSMTARMAINRAVRRSPALSVEPQGLAAACIDRQTPLASALAREERLQVRAGLRRLKRTDRATLKAFYIDGQSLVEMSDQFAAPVGTIKRRLHVARKRLAKELEELAPV
jgi:RNA polymerase sigma-70 factor, ECF subfamily